MQFDGTPASTTDRTTWTNWADVAERPHGIMLGDGLGCIDLDHCLVDGEANELAREVLASVDPVWVERSMSGDGLHIFIEAEPAPGRTMPGFEVYSRERFIVVTGDAFTTTAR